MIALLLVLPALAGGLCADAETLVYACPVAGGKTAALCRDADRLTYRFGRPGGVELAFPATPRPASEAFTRASTYGGPRVSSCTLSFENEGYRYELLYSYFHGEEERSLSVKTPQGKVVTLACVAPTEGTPCDVDGLVEDQVLITLRARVGALEQRLASATCLSPTDRESAQGALAELRAVVTPHAAWAAIEGDPLSEEPPAVEALEEALACPAP